MSYTLLDSGNQLRLEKWGDTLVVRPDPNAIWQPTPSALAMWQDAAAIYEGKGGEGTWHFHTPGLAEGWEVLIEQMRFLVKPTPFRHLGLFPEQQKQWKWVEEKIAGHNKPSQVLNLFGYTGAASLFAARAGASVCQVDASQASTYWAKENARRNKLDEKPIRWIVDDCLKFMRREVRRGSVYDIILMDPPVFGRGPKGEVWRIEQGITELAELTSQLLTKKPLAVVVNFYATTLYPKAIERLFLESLEGVKECKLSPVTVFESESGKENQTGFELIITF